MLVLYYVADLPVEQIAHDRGIPVGTVKSRLAAGRRRLKLGLAQVRNLTGQKVTLEYECSGKPLCAVSYDIQVPRGKAVLVDSDRGDIPLSSLAGGVEATSGTGTITANGLSSPEAAFLAVGGSVNAVFTAVPTTVHAASAGGDITIRVPGTVSYQVNIRPGNGKAIVSVPQSFSTRHLIAANSNEGDVTVASSS